MNCSQVTYKAFVSMTMKYTRPAFFKFLQKKSSFYESICENIILYNEIIYRFDQVKLIKHLEVWLKHLFLDQQVQTEFYHWYPLSLDPPIGAGHTGMQRYSCGVVYWSCYQSAAMLPAPYLHHLVWMCEALCASESSQAKPKSITFTLNGWSTVIILSVSDLHAQYLLRNHRDLPKLKSRIIML